MINHFLVQISGTEQTLAILPKRRKRQDLFGRHFSLCFYCVLYGLWIMLRSSTFLFSVSILFEC